MSRTLTLSQLAEGIQRTAANAGDDRMVGKWSRTGLLEGLSAAGKQKMARLLENQAVEVLKGGSSMLNESLSLSTGGASLASSGQVAGFTNVAFPIVRRVFAGLVANEIVSVQPMSLPSGLLFYLDYTYGSYVGGDAGTSGNQYAVGADPGAATYARGQSVYTNPSGSVIRTSGSLAAGGQYNLIGSGYSKVHVQGNLAGAAQATILGAWTGGTYWATGSTVASASAVVGYNARFVDYDPTLAADVEASQLDYTFLVVSASALTTAINGADLTSVEQIALTGFGGSTATFLNVPQTYQQGEAVKNFRRFTKRGNWTDAGTSSTFTPDPFNGTHLLFALALANGVTAINGAGFVGNGAPANTGVTASAPIADALSVNADGSALTIPSFESNFAVDASPRIPDVDIKIDSVAVTATTRKLRARWSPEMAQDLTAFYSIDVEAELTNILSEMITLDIDREILNDLLTQAQAANYFWSRAPGRFVNKYTGTEVARTNTVYPGPQFTGTVREWYETLIETITDAANVIHKKTLRGSGNFIVCSPEVGTILEATVAYRANYKIDGDGQVRDNMSIGAEAVGTVNGRYSVFVDPYFPVNKILIGLKGSTFLESGYIYAPYVPLILTPVIYGQEDFTPRKGIMTRYGKKMVRADFYATVTCLDMSII
jgi:hypothetical protein